MKRAVKRRIAVSINGEGKGHVTRMTAVIERLSGRFEPVFFCPDTIRTELAAAFPESVIHEIPAVKFVMYNFEIDYVRTTFENIQTILSAGNIIGALVNLLRKSESWDSSPTSNRLCRKPLPGSFSDRPAESSGVVTRVGAWPRRRSFPCGCRSDDVQIR
jgi:hypothetical protein